MTQTLPFPDPLRHLDQLIQRDAKGRVAFGVGLRLTLYFDDAHTPVVRSQVLACLSDYLDQTASHLACCGLPDRRAWTTFAPDVLDELRAWLAGADADTPWEFVATGTADDAEASPFYVGVLAAAEWERRARQKLSFLTATFPVTWFQDRDERLVALLLKWANRLAPQHGFGGFGFYVPDDRAALARAEKLLYGLARRFVGVELDNPVTQLRFLSTRLKGVNWLTVVGDAFLNELGGRTAVAAQLPADALVHDYAGGVVVQLGPRPQIGDVAAGKTPESYAALSRTLRPVQVDPATGWGVSATSGYDREGTRALLARFDGADVT